ncbi:MAG: hypothetical protein IPM29_01885 [Planctomycetes bacterium]|nr:hypothetical protein [Planctomycetota bacterium]
MATPTPAPWVALDAAAGVFLPPALHTELASDARIVFCPDDETGRSPFEAPRVDGEPLGVRCALERAPSLSVWARLLARPASVGIRPAAVVVDSVALPAAEAEEFDPLRSSGHEGDLVAAAWPGLCPTPSRPPRSRQDLRDLPRLDCLLSRSPSPQRRRPSQGGSSETPLSFLPAASAGSCRV